MIFSRLDLSAGTREVSQRAEGPLALREAPYGHWANRSVLAAFKFALALKTAWLLSPYNVDRVLRGHFPLGLAVGIHLGDVAFVGNPSKPQIETSDFVGYEINLAKRIEGTGRIGRFTSIMVSPIIHFIARQSLPGIVFHSHQATDLKGIYGASRIFELVEILDFEHYLLKTWKPGIATLGERPPGYNRLLDSLGVMVSHHLYDAGFRFLIATALQYCNEIEGVRRVISEGLFRTEYDAANGHWKAMEVQDCYDVLMRIYDQIKGFPGADALLAKCATGLKKPAFNYYMRRAWRPSEFFVDGEWTKDGPAD